MPRYSGGAKLRTNFVPKNEIGRKIELLAENSQQLAVSGWQFWVIDRKVVPKLHFLKKSEARSWE